MCSVGTQDAKSLTDSELGTRDSPFSRVGTRRRKEGRERNVRRTLQSRTGSRVPWTQVSKARSAFLRVQVSGTVFSCFSEIRVSRLQRSLTHARPHARMESNEFWREGERLVQLKPKRTREGSREGMGDANSCSK